jgi:alanine-glyoxylate transaminase/serine-glyoxylate transaminase/serine-pyruvate transaminase
MTRKPGRQFFANPGPTNIPDTVLRAIDHVTVDFNDPDFLEVYDAGVAGMKRMLHTDGEVFIYTASGHGAWEATMANLFSPGDLVLMPDSGFFSLGWAAIAKDLGLEVRAVAADWRRGVEVSAIRAALAEDTAHRIKAVCLVHNETSTGVTLNLPEFRAVLDALGHPALLLADTISSLGSMEFRMKEWGIDAVVGGSQKGLMLPTGFSFTAVSEKAMAAHQQSRLPKHYFYWTNMMARRQRSFTGTIPTSLFYGLRESIRLIEEEGLDAVIARHTRLAEGVRRAIRVWSANNGPQLYCTDPARVSNTVTPILMPEGYDAEAIRAIALQKFNVALGFGLPPTTGKLFRIGHLGDLNEPMVLGTLAAVEMAFDIAGVPHGKGGVAAAMAFFANAAR